jgi:hypothetical protein
MPRALAPRLLRLQISVPSANQLPGLTVRRDDAAVPGEALGSVLPVNPGNYTINASAPGYLPWSTNIDVEMPGRSSRWTFPGWSRFRCRYRACLEARSKWNSAGTHCDANHVCDPAGVSIDHDARAFGTAGTIVGGVGLTALIAGAVLYATAPAARRVVEHARLDVDRVSGVRISIGGWFDASAWQPRRPTTASARRVCRFGSAAG